MLGLLHKLPVERLQVPSASHCHSEFHEPSWWIGSEVDYALSLDALLLVKLDYFPDVAQDFCWIHFTSEGKIVPANAEHNEFFLVERIVDFDLSTAPRARRISCFIRAVDLLSMAHIVSANLYWETLF